MPRLKDVPSQLPEGRSVQVGWFGRQFFSGRAVRFRALPQTATPFAELVGPVEPVELVELVGFIRAVTVRDTPEITS